MGRKVPRARLCENTDFLTFEGFFDFLSRYFQTIVLRNWLVEVFTDRPHITISNFKGTFFFYNKHGELNGLRAIWRESNIPKPEIGFLNVLIFFQIAFQIGHAERNSLLLIRSDFRLQPLQISYSIHDLSQIIFEYQTCLRNDHLVLLWILIITWVLL